MMEDILLFLFYSEHKIIYHNFQKALLQSAFQQSHNESDEILKEFTFYQQNFKTHTVIKKSHTFCNFI